MVFGAFLCSNSFGQSTAIRLVDSAEFYIASEPTVGMKFLDSIPQPIQKTLKGYLTEYYNTKGSLFYYLGNNSLAHKNYLLALHHAEEERKFNVAGDLCLELYMLEVQGSASKKDFFLNKAKTFYQKTGNINGLLDVRLQPAYAAFYDGDFRKSIEINLSLLPEIEKRQDQYLHFLSLFMLSSCYINSNDYVKGQVYFEKLKKLEGKMGVTDEMLDFYQTSLDFDRSEYFYIKENADSARYYFDKTMASESILDATFKQELFNLGIDVYKLTNEINISNQFKDSLFELEAEMNEQANEVIFETGKDLFNAKNDLNEMNRSKIFYVLNIVALLAILISVSVLLYKYRLKIKHGSKSVKNKMEELLSAQTENKQMRARIVSLEDYITEIKGSIKNVTNSKNESEQREKVDELYKELNITSKTILDQDNVRAMNQVNEEFFERIKVVFPDLNESEQLICYYLSIGLKNKEIAFYMKSSIRAIESKRYRIGKKMNITTNQKSISEYIKENDNSVD